MSSIMPTNYEQALITLLIAMGTILWLDQLSLLWHALRYLRWLLIPLTLLHLVFTPGMLLAPALPWSPSLEGVDAALWQSLRLINWFLSGWLLTYLVSHREWQYLLMRLPKIGQQWATILAAVPPMLQRSKQILMLMRWRWQHEHGKWRDIPSIACAMVMTILVQGNNQAELHWISQSRFPTIRLIHPPYAWLQIMLVAVSWVIVWSLW